MVKAVKESLFHLDFSPKPSRVINGKMFNVSCDWQFHELTATVPYVWDQIDFVSWHDNVACSTEQPLTLDLFITRYFWARIFMFGNFPALAITSQDGRTSQASVNHIWNSMTVFCWWHRRL
jgi:hypothetical protein